MNSDITCKLYGGFGHYYDLHTPPHHYRDDHAFVIEHMRAFGGKGRILDVGCGTGILLEKALSTGLDPFGIDPAPRMLDLARERVGSRRVELMRMQDLEYKEAFDCIVSLSWSINYCNNFSELRDVLGRCFRALNPGAGMILQVAHAPNASCEAPPFNSDREWGPGGANDITLHYRFWAEGPQHLNAEYAFECASRGEYFQERHKLGVANVEIVAATLFEVGFIEVTILDSWRGEPFGNSISPFVLARRSK